MVSPQKQYDVALTVGVFDVWHRGHQDLADYMAELADIRIAIIHDGISTFKNKGHVPMQSIASRAYFARTIGGFEVFGTKYADPSIRIVHVRNICLRRGLTKACFVRGDDWQDFPGRKIVESLGIDILFKRYTEGVSSTEILKGGKKKI